MDVLRVGVCCNDDFVVLPLLRQLQSNGVCFLRCDIFIRVEGLHEMKIHFAVTLAVLKFGKHPDAHEKQKITEWLKARTGAKQLRLIAE